MNILTIKRELRKEMLAKRANLSTQKKLKYDQWICESLWEIVKENNYKTVHCYLPMGSEINITPWIEKLLENDLTVVAPKTLPNRKLKNLVLNSLKQVEAGVFGTTYPSGDIEYVGEYDLIILPGLAFDSNNYRLGYGGGYYDNFIINYPSAKKIGIFYPFQETKNVPIEGHDLQLDRILVNQDYFLSI